MRRRKRNEPLAVDKFFRLAQDGFWKVPMDPRLVEHREWLLGPVADSVLDQSM